MATWRDTVLETAFPDLLSTGYEITSSTTEFGIHPRPYNCIAWAADDNTHWWDEGIGSSDLYWPPVRRDGRLEALIAAFEWIGYRLCANGDAERGYDKVALYATVNPDGSYKWTHAAKRLPDGRWTSKCGYLQDVAHNELRGVDCWRYGTTVRFMRRWWLRKGLRWLKVRIFGIRGPIRWLR